MAINLLSIISALKSGNGEDIYNEMFNGNPQFRKFVEENRGLTNEQMAKKYGISIDDVTKFLK